MAASFLWMAGGLAAGQRTLLDADWKFQLGEVAGAEAVKFDDRPWRRVDLPHDWSIEGKVDETAPSTGLGGFFPTGKGWYRKSFIVPEKLRGQRVVVEFEGIYRDAEIWVNGVSLGRRPYGYSPVRHDLTPHLKYGVANILSVGVDNSAQPNSRWYTGSGIYRHVWMHVLPAVHIEPWAVWVQTETLDAKEARIQVQTTVRNETARAARFDLELDIFEGGRKSVATANREIEIAANTSVTVSETILVTKPRAWSPESPTIYRVVSKLSQAGEVKDETTTRFGIRTVQVSAGSGFELNGRTLKLNGSNVHHDHGSLGAASFDRAEERKVQILKAAGFNAVRTAHNPPSPAFLEACDRLGLLVMDEAFDGWASAKNKKDYSVDFHEWSARDLETLVRRDRNHPSVVMWSIGNEMFERGTASGLKIAERLTAQIRELDPSRPITAGVNGLGKPADWPKLDPLFATLDVAGYNYEMQHAAADHARLPERVIAVAESYQNEVFAMWKTVRDHPYVIGEFVWSGMDYLGEAGIGRVFPPDEKVVKHWEGSMFPWHGATCGDIDLTGLRKPNSHYRNIVWERGEKLYAAVVPPAPEGKAWNLSPWALPPRVASWNWAGHEGDMLTVEVYSRHDAVKLLLNGVLIGEKTTSEAEEFIATFEVPYSAGTLEVIGLRSGWAVDRFRLRTAGEAEALELRADRARMKADGQDLIFVSVEAVDAKGLLRADAAPAVKFDVEGPATIAGVGSADLMSDEVYGANPRKLYQGRGQVVLRATGQGGKITLRAQADGLAPAKIVVRAEK
ncbi:glycoside hydrolase family 2 TIM barrel-domain containing protein [Oleiharenicola lentus]|uniref:glycoside hydrolase family 2 TIM barrel-domain containing protein n=1 Tax=Oleiharenicola lentus TaxID=2508720 RepID=UPI003F67C240